MRHSRTLPALGLLLALSPSAWAGPPPKASSPVTTTTAATDRARALHVEGAKLYEEGKYEQAYVAFVAAWALKQHPAIAGNLADCEVKLGKHRDAAEHYRFIVRNASGEAKAEDVRRAEERLREVRKEIGALKIEAAIDGVDVFVDGKLVGQTPLAEEVFVDPGERKVEARHPREGSEMRLARVEEGAAVTVRLTVGVHAPEAPVRPPVVGPPPSQRPVWPIAVGGGATAVFLAGGIAFAVVSNGKRHDVETLDAAIDKDHHRCAAPGPIDTRCTELISTARSADTFNRVAIGAFVGAGVLAVGTLTYLLWPAPRAPKATTAGIDVRVAPVLGAGRGGLLVGGAF